MQRFYLILLIGSNPLPNLVAAVALKKHISKCWLIHSSGEHGTKQYAENIKKAIGEKISIGDIELRSLSNISSASNIENDLQNIGVDQNHEVHLHYTGGTKAMAVHSYRYLKQQCHDNFSASYLDARKFEIVFDYSFNPAIENLRQEIDIRIEEILALHNYQITPNCTYKDLPYPEFNKQTEQLAQWIQEQKINDSFLPAVENFIRNIYKGSNNILEKRKIFIKHIQKNGIQSKINEFNKHLREEEPFKNFLNSFDEQSLLENGEVWIPEEDVTNQQLKSRLKNTIAYLDGKWLEAVIYRQIEQWAQKNNLLDGQWGFSLEAYNVQDVNKHNFELDAFVIIGYQLIGISITTDKGGHAKLKGFEVNHRIHQIGGDEARAVLICGLKGESKKQLEQDLQSFTGTSAGQIIVLDQEDWLNIGNALDRIAQN